MSPEERLLESWKVTIEVQMHFNELEMKVRSFAITVLAAFLAAVGFVLKEDLELRIFGKGLSLSGMILLAAILCWGAFYLMDRLWYHRLLRGAVNQGISLENQAKTIFPELNLGNEISKASPVKFRNKDYGSDKKIDIFYGLIGGVLLFAAAVAFLNDPDQPSSTSFPSSSQSQQLDEIKPQGQKPKLPEPSRR